MVSGLFDAVGYAIVHPIKTALAVVLVGSAVRSCFHTSDRVVFVIRCPKKDDETVEEKTTTESKDKKK